MRWYVWVRTRRRRAREALGSFATDAASTILVHQANDDEDVHVITAPPSIASVTQ